MSPPRVRFPIGISDFRNVREGGFTYVDKTALIDDVLTESAQVMLAPRPRRFGKTLNLSMLRYFFEKSTEDRRPLFAGLAVASSESAWVHFQRYPVIFMTFKDVKPRSWDDCLGGMANVLAEAYQSHRYLLTEGNLDPADVQLFTAICERRAAKSELLIALKVLSRLLARYHGEKVVILIDEYDTPIHAGYTNKYYEDVVAFFRDFLSSGLKDNADLFKGVLTGILRVAKESLFSGLNNIDVYSILRSRLATAFGFTEPEVRELAESARQAESLDGIRSFYNGYLFGGQAIYNPWSVLSFLNREDNVFRPYWIETSSNDLVRELLLIGPRGVAAELETLLAGGTLDKRIDESIVLRNIATRTDALWSFLLFTGYLKAVDVRYVENDVEARLMVPNQEVASALRGMVRDWFTDEAGGSDRLQSFLDALHRGDAAVVEVHLGHLVKVNVSFFDTASPEPERFYHGLVVGLLAGLAPRYEVRSNRESGLGRCDVMILPKTAGQPGVVLELKRVDTEAGETREKAFNAAFRQIRERDYAAELRERGAAPIHLMAAVFEGKRVFVRASGEKKKTARKAAAKKTTTKKRAAPVQKGSRRTR
jgi:predicted AAA-ATPase/PD-(D/E)XK nuclease superfamily protein